MSQRDSGTTGVAGLRWVRAGGIRIGKVKGVKNVRDDEPIYHDELEQFKPYYMEEWREETDEFEDDDESDPLTIFDCCDYCGAVWGMDELERERCASCGWVVGTLYEGDDEDEYDE